MINIVTLFSLALATLHMAVAPASAHGYVIYPPSRQARCSIGEVPDCGSVRYEPQSVDGLKGSFKCNGDGQRFRELNDDAIWEPYFYSVASNIESITFTWSLHTAHRTSLWEYFLITESNTLLTSFNGHNETPTAIVQHQVPLKGYTGRQTVLARWDIGDTPAAFYSCVDFDIEDSLADAAPAQRPIGVCK